jgi:hypothetical protein
MTMSRSSCLARVNKILPTFYSNVVSRCSIFWAPLLCTRARVAASETLSKMECPVCNAFSCADGDELARHVDECLNRGDAELAAKLAAEDSVGNHGANDAALAARLAAEQDSLDNHIDDDDDDDDKDNDSDDDGFVAIGHAAERDIRPMRSANSSNSMVLRDDADSPSLRKSAIINLASDSEESEEVWLLLFT